MRRRYGVSGRVWWSACGASAVGWSTCAVKLLHDHVLATPVKLSILVAVTAVFALVLGWAKRSATVIQPSSGIEVRGLWRTQRFDWPVVQDIRVEMNPGALAKKNAPAEMVVVYDLKGRRTTLPHLNQKNLQGLGTELDAIRRAWEQGRGSGWRPIPHIAAKVAERQKYKVSSWALGLIAMAAAVPIGVILLIAGLATGNAHGIFFGPVGIVGLQLVAYGSTVGVSLVRRRMLRRRLPALEQ